MGTPRAAADRSQTTRAVNDQPRSILVVDDEHSIVETLVELLTWEGYLATTADNGQAALDAMQLHTPDLVLIDYMMPVMDGLRVLERMRAEPRLASVPVVLMTAAQLPPVEPRWNARLTKPFDASVLLKTVKDLIG